MAALQTALAIAYPLVIYFALQQLQPRAIALVLLGLLALRVALAGREQWLRTTRAFWLPAAAVGVVAAVTAAWNDPLSLLLAPSFVSAALLGSFGLTLLRGTPMIERFARAQVRGELSVEERVHCRRMTQIWCWFFLANGSAAAWLAMTGDLEAWTLYTGLLAYLAMGALLVGELVIRKWRFRRYEGAPSDAFFRRLFPPRESGPSAAEADVGLRPLVLAERVELGRIEQELEVPRDLACWPGHFPSLELVPGVVQLDWVMQLGERSLGWRAGPVRIEAVKFLRPLLPGQKLTLILETLEDGAAPTRAKFRLEGAGGASFTQGRISRVEDETAK